MKKYHYYYHSDEEFEYDVKRIARKEAFKYSLALAGGLLIGSIINVILQKTNSEETVSIIEESEP